jgi:Transglutaminase-like superfamily/Domain of unknown function (DUF4129)
LMKSFQSAPFTYDTTIDLGTTANALDKFLFESHKGFCEQYAAAFAELARSVGLPTRVAVGYQRGQLGTDGLWHVQEKDAHAWPEVWLGPTVGWYRFEPTPGRTDPVTGLGSNSSGGGGPTTTSTTAPKNEASTPPTSSLTPTSFRSEVPDHSSGTSSSSGARGHVVTAVFAIVALAAGAFLVLLGAMAFGAWRRTRRRRNDPDDRRRVLGAWTEALEQLDAAGIKRRPATTSLEFALRQAPALGAGAAGPPLMDLARLHTAAMYSPDAPSPEEADEAWAEVDAISAAIRVTVPRSRRWKARWSAAVSRARARARIDRPGDEEPAAEAALSR